MYLLVQISTIHVFTVQQSNGYYIKGIESGTVHPYPQFDNLNNGK